MIPIWQMEGYERLRTEVVRAAVKDLQRALKKSDRLGYVCDEQKNLEEWFKSRWGQLLCGDNGEYMIEKCHQTYKTRSHFNGKTPLPEKVQKQICKEYQNGTKTALILKKYGISHSRMTKILRRWDV